MSRVLVFVSLLPLMFSAYSQQDSAYYIQCRAPDGRVTDEVPCPPGFSRQMVFGAKPGLPVVSERYSEAVVTTLRRSADGHYRAIGAVNGVRFNMLADTGATMVAMSQEQARMAGIDITRGRRSSASTANGVVPTLITKAASVSFAGQTVHDVLVTVHLNSSFSAEMLVGMSFLKHFDVSMNGGLLTLTRR